VFLSQTFSTGAGARLPPPSRAKQQDTFGESEDQRTPRSRTSGRRSRDARRFQRPAALYCVRYFTGFFIIFHSPDFWLYTQLQNASHSLLMLGLSARK